MKVVVLLSGGQDSTTSLFWAKRSFPNAELHALTLFYGQRHAVEVEAATKIAKLAGCASHRVITCPVLGEADSDLVRTDTDIKADGGLKDAAAPNGLPSSFVPGRNLVFLALAAAHAGAIGAGAIVTGVCQTDYSGYPDCRAEFVEAVQRAIAKAWPSGEFCPLVYTPLMQLTKAETVRLAQTLDGCMDALAHSLTCYYGTKCGKCPACELRAKGFEEAGVADPARS